jgi:hypothetical protein
MNDVVDIASVFMRVGTMTFTGKGHCEMQLWAGRR